MDMPVFEPATPRVLVAEDNTLIAMDLEDILTAFGCQVVGPAGSVREALAVLADGNIEAAVVDFQLEDGTAERLADALDKKGIPFAICTGTEENIISSRYPYTPILSKPFTKDEVSVVVNSLIAAKLGRE